MFSGSTKTLADINQRYASVCQDKVFYPNKTFLDLLLEVFDQDQLDFVTGERQPGSGFQLGRNQQASNFKTQLLSMYALKAIDAQALVSLLEAFQQIKETENWKVFRTFENNFLLEGFYSLHAYAAAISNLQPVNPKHKKDLNSDIERLSEIEEEIIAGSDSAKIEPTVPLDTLLGFDKNQSALSPALKALRRTLIEADFIAVCLSEKAGQKMRLLNKAVAVEIAGNFFDNSGFDRKAIPSLEFVRPLKEELYLNLRKEARVLNSITIECFNRALQGQECDYSFSDPEVFEDYLRRRALAGLPPRKILNSLPSPLKGSEHDSFKSAN